jgi:hypothetical protein
MPYAPKREQQERERVSEGGRERGGERERHTTI